MRSFANEEEARGALDEIERELDAPVGFDVTSTIPLLNEIIDHFPRLVDRAEMLLEMVMNAKSARCMGAHFVYR